MQFLLAEGEAVPEMLVAGCNMARKLFGEQHSCLISSTAFLCVMKILPIIIILGWVIFCSTLGDLGGRPGVKGKEEVARPWQVHNLSYDINLGIPFDL